jgi:poly(3-hydroxybutyrate) depolymerase
MWTAAIVALFLCANAFAQSLPPGVGKKDIQSGSTRQSYYFYVPEHAKNAKAMPVIVVMHGSGGDGLGQVLAWMALAEANHVILIGPNIGNSVAAWDELYDHPKWILDAIAEVGKKNPVDGRRVYLWGYSAGGIFAFYLAFMESRYFAAAAVHGGVIEQFKYQLADFAVRKVPFAYYIGTRDQWWTVEQTRASRDALIRRGFTVHYTELKGADHNFYARSEEITADAWKFMKEYALDSDPEFDALDLPRIRAAFRLPASAK